jgi:co-chaperonin GroES (HSP10)
MPLPSPPCERRDRTDSEAKSASGIVFSDTTKEKPRQGNVVGVGPASSIVEEAS